MIKVCKRCGESKGAELFPKHKENRDGRAGCCWVCTNAKTMEYRRRTGDACTKKYEKTPKGFVMRMYRNMLSRIRGIQKKSAYLYTGKDILPKEEFYDWCLNNDDFKILFEKYSASGYDRQLAPSVDREDASIGYVISNMRIITHFDNSKKASDLAIQRHKTGTVLRPSVKRPGYKACLLIPGEVLDIRKRSSNGESPSDLAKEFGVTVSNIYAILNRKSWKYLPQEAA